MQELLLYGGCFFVVAFLYASVGHGGASGYLALMALFGFAPMLIKPTALLLNVMVSMIAFISFYKAKHFKSSMLWPLILGSIPFSYLGSIINLPDSVYKKILAIVLLLSIVRLVWTSSNQALKPSPKPYLLFIIGASIGLLSGMIGMGGGILLSPILILMHWANLKQTAAISAIFIFLNSVAGMIGQLQKGFVLNEQVYWIIGFVLVGGWIGAYTGSKKLQPQKMKWVLATVLILAAGKLFFVK
jgi:uncharacterized protein